MLFIIRMNITVHSTATCSCTGIEDEQDDALPSDRQTQMRYDDEGIDSEDDFIDDDLADGTHGQQPRRARGKGKTAGVHNQAVQVWQKLLLIVLAMYLPWSCMAAL